MVSSVSSVLLLHVCCACSSYRTVTVHVTDAETGKPVPNALIRTYRYEGWPYWEQQEARSYPAPQGVARVRAIKDPLGVVAIAPEAPGYLPYWADGAYADGTPVSDIRITELKPWPFDEVTLTLYREPQPQVVLIIPDNYRGLVHVAMPMGRRPQMHGRRLFEIQCETGTTAILPPLPGPPLGIDRVRRASGEVFPSVQRVAPDVVTAREVWEGSLPLPDVRKGEGENVWIVTRRPPEEWIVVFVVGTASDQRRAKELSKTMRPVDGAPPTTLPMTP